MGELDKWSRSDKILAASATMSYKQNEDLKSGLNAIEKMNGESLGIQQKNLDVTKDNLRVNQDNLGVNIANHMQLKDQTEELRKQTRSGEKAAAALNELKNSSESAAKSSEEIKDIHKEEARFKSDEREQAKRLSLAKQVLFEVKSDLLKIRGSNRAKLDIFFNVQSLRLLVDSSGISPTITTDFQEKEYIKEVFDLMDEMSSVELFSEEEKKDLISIADILADDEEQVIQEKHQRLQLIETRMMTNESKITVAEELITAIDEQCTATVNKIINLDKKIKVVDEDVVKLKDRWDKSGASHALDID
jgi:hypothetical protein